MLKYLCSQKFKERKLENLVQIKLLKSNIFRRYINDDELKNFINFTIEALVDKSNYQELIEFND